MDVVTLDRTDEGFGHSIALWTFDWRRSRFEADVASEAACLAGDVTAAIVDSHSMVTGRRLTSPKRCSTAASIRLPGHPLAEDTHQQPARAVMREIRRRTRVVGAFPDGQSCLNLAAARLRYIVGTAWSTKCYMNMRPLYQPQLMQTEAVA